MMTLWKRWDPGQVVTGPDFLNSDPKLAKMAQNGTDAEFFAFIDQTT